MANFAVTGVAGFVAPRHLQAIRDTGNQVVAAVDPHDAVGVLDRHSFDVRFFTEFERFDRYLDKLRRESAEKRVHYLSVCSPNYLHDAHARAALRVGADVICEKPLVINPWNLDALQALELETGRRVFSVLQLRLHPKLVELREQLAQQPSSGRHRVRLTYVTGRGRWYLNSWKGAEERSGGLLMNIGIHFFDLLLWLFGPADASEVHLRTPRQAAGSLTLRNADVQWFLSTDVADLPAPVPQGTPATYRSLLIDGKEIEFSDGFTNLHTEVYRQVLEGRGFGIDDARPSIKLTSEMRNAPVTATNGDATPVFAHSEARSS